MTPAIDQTEYRRRLRAIHRSDIVLSGRYYSPRHQIWESRLKRLDALIYPLTEAGYWATRERRPKQRITGWHRQRRRKRLAKRALLLAQEPPKMIPFGKHDRVARRRYLRRLVKAAMIVEQIKKLKREGNLCQSTPSQPAS
jgi:hypothetical protein